MHARDLATTARGLTGALLAVVVALATVLPTATASATVDPPTIGDDGDVGVGSGGTGGGGGGGTGSGGGWTLPDGYTIITLRSLEPQDDGTYCIQTVGEVVPEDEAVDRQSLNSAQFFRMYDRLELAGLIAGDCPSEPPVDPTPAYAFVDRVLEQLPRPAPVLEPGGRAITGNAAYLQTSRPLTFGPVTESLFLGPAIGEVPVTITGTASYTVAWGDHPDGPASTDGTTYTWPGGPYPGTGPDGAVTHSYIDTGSHTVRVTDTWNVSIELGTPLLAIDDITATLTERTVDVRVTELRSTRDR